MDTDRSVPTAAAFDPDRLVGTTWEKVARKAYDSYILHFLGADLPRPTSADDYLIGSIGGGWEGLPASYRKGFLLLARDVDNAWRTVQPAWDEPLVHPLASIALWSGWSAYAASLLGTAAALDPVLKAILAGLGAAGGTYAPTFLEKHPLRGLLDRLRGKKDVRRTRGGA